MIPIIAIIGRSNVGKSTLFNKLTRTRDALVADLPGLTHDRKYGRSYLGKYEFICIDTGGINYNKKDNLQASITKQSMLAIEEANSILFIVDAHAGLMPEDFMIAKFLHTCKKSSFLIINKIDKINADKVIIDFKALGFSSLNTYPIAALYRRGLTNLLKNLIKTIFNPLMYKLNLESKTSSELKSLNIYKKNNIIKKNQFFILSGIPIKLAIVGYMNVGKSTIINYLAGEERVITYDKPGTTRDNIYIPVEYHDRKYVLIDTPGICKLNKFNKIPEKILTDVTLQTIRDSNITMLVIDACRGVSNQDLSIINFIVKIGRPLIIVVNKWDILNTKEKQDFKEILNDQLNFFYFTKIYFVSALHGHGIYDMFNSVHRIYNQSIRRVSASKLTHIMITAIKKHQPPLVYGRRISLKYAHASSYNPLIIVIHGNQVQELSDSYKRYLVNHFCRSLKLSGIPIRISFKENKNPFIK